MVWFARSSSDVLWRIDPHTNLVTLAIAVGHGPSAIAVGDGAVWVANSRSGSITRVDPARGEPTTFALGSRPGAIVAAYNVVWVSPGQPRG
jgi:streptogramin lyase